MNSLQTPSPTTRHPADAGMLQALWAALRPYQWTKNLVLFAAPIFSQQIHLPEQAARSLGAFAIFCALSSASYLFNDVRDIEEDRMHPVKCYRPVASGALSTSFARIVSILLLLGALAAATLLGRMFFIAALLYVVLQVAYSLALKNIALLDVLAIAVGFVMRALAGALAINVQFTDWLVVCSLFLALFLALGKRRSELALVQQGYPNSRKVLIQYTPQFVDTLLIVAATSALLTYTIYTCSPETIARIGTDKMYVTLPLVLYGLFRYFWLIHEGQSDDPSRILVRDVPLALTVLAWVLLSLVLLYSDGMGDTSGGLFLLSG